MSLPPLANGNNMSKEPITLNGLNKLKEELIFLKKKDQKSLQLFLRPDHMAI